MKNITLSIDDETYRRARIVAAERNTSVSGLVRAYLKTLAAGGFREDRGTAALFEVLDRSKSFRASRRLTRDEAHARGRVP